VAALQTKNQNQSPQPKWIYTQGFYFEPRAGGEVRIFGFYNNKETNKEKPDLAGRFWASLLLRTTCMRS